MEAAYCWYRLVGHALNRSERLISVLCKEDGVIKLIFAALLVMLALSGCDKSYSWDGSLEALMASKPDHFAGVLANPSKHRVQIIYTQIDRDADNVPSFHSFEYRLNADEYFYPASTVKLPTALLALEKLRDVGVDRDAIMLSGASDSGKSVGRYIREILLVSDNDAFNRLYEFLGQSPLNERMSELGFDGTRIMHRLSVALSVEENRTTGPIRFMDGESVVYEEAAAYSDTNYAAPAQIPLGVAEVVGDELIEQPKDFATKNAFPLQAQHDVIKALMFPESVDADNRFDLSDEDYDFVYRNMSAYPGESGISEYMDASRHPEGYVKFLMYGGDEPSIPDSIRIFNKVGDAYGFLTDAAYIVDFENGVEFILAATIYTNENQTFNDNIYEYDEIGFPFMRQLGQAIYVVELQRERTNEPDLSHLAKLHSPSDQ